MSKEANIRLLKAMHEVVISMNDENAYERWILVVPDEPTEDDFEYMANDDELMDDACRLFRSIVKTHGKYGWFTAYAESGTLMVYGADEN